MLAVIERTQLRLRTDQSLSRRAKQSYADGLKDARAAVAELLYAAEEAQLYLDEMCAGTATRAKLRAALARCKREKA